MNREQRRSLTKGERREVETRLKNVDIDLRRQIASIDQLILSRGKELAAEILQSSLTPFICKFLKEDFGVDLEKLDNFEEKIN